MKMVMLVGNVGCGKSTLADELVASYGDKEINVVNMDSIVMMLSGGKYVYKMYNKEIYRRIEETVIRQSLSKGIDIIIDRTNMDKKRRGRFISIGKEYKAEIICYDFGRGVVDDLNRRLSDMRGESAGVWKRVFTMMQNNYERPELDEGFDKIERMRSHT